MNFEVRLSDGSVDRFADVKWETDMGGGNWRYSHIQHDFVVAEGDALTVRKCLTVNDYDGSNETQDTSTVGYFRSQQWTTVREG
jgi:hypothetical protein